MLVRFFVVLGSRRPQGAANVAGHYAAERLDGLEEFVRSLTRRKLLRYLDFSISGSGLLARQRLFDRFGRHLEDVSIEEVATRFVAIATELGTGHEVWLRRGRIIDAVRASSAIPGIVRPVRVNGHWLIDGSLVNPIRSSNWSPSDEGDQRTQVNVVQAASAVKE